MWCQLGPDWMSVCIQNKVRKRTNQGRAIVVFADCLLLFQPSKTWGLWLSGWGTIAAEIYGFLALRDPSYP